MPDNWGGPGTSPRFFTAPANSTHGRTSRNIFIIDNFVGDIDSAPGDGSYVVYGTYRGIAIMGNFLGSTINSSYGGYHFRFTGARDIIISNNYMEDARVTASLRALGKYCSMCNGVSNPPENCDMDFTNILVQDNDVTSNTGPLLGGTSATCRSGEINPSSHKVGFYDGIIERNIFHSVPSTTEKRTQSSFAVNSYVAGTDRVAVRNNITDMTGWSHSHCFAIIGGQKAYNNTCFRSDVRDDGTQETRGIRATSPAAAAINIAKVAPNYTGTIMVTEGTITDKRNNLTFGPGSVQVFDDPTPVTADDFKPKSNSPLINAGISYPGLYDDYFMKRRTGSIDVGAIEFQGIECTSNSQCNDNLYCTGTETCEGGQCVNSGNPCSGSTPICLEASDSCAACTSDADCDDSNECTNDTCNGTCSSTNLSSGTPCTGGICDGSGTCESTGCLTSSIPNWDSTSFNTQTGSFTIEFDATPTELGMDGLVGLSNGTAAGYSDSFVTLWFNWDNEIEAWDETADNPYSENPGWYNSIVPITYEADTTYHFKFVVNVPSHTYSAYVTPPSGGEQPILENVAFRDNLPSPSQLTHLHVYAGSGLGSSTGTHSVCNIQLIGGSSNIGDLNNDLIVDIFDLVIIGSNFGKTPVDPDFDPRADSDNDNDVDILDLKEVADNFGNTYS